MTGTRRAVLVEGVVIALGHYVLAVPASASVYPGLLLVALGTGMLKPYISTMVGQLYDQRPESEHHSRRDAGFSIFYMGVNVGAWSGVLVTGFLAMRYGWHRGFAAAATGMTIAIVQYVGAGRMLGDIGRTPPLLGIGASFVVMGFAGSAASAGPISPLWLLSVYLIQTVAELFLSPVGPSVTTKLARSGWPAR